MCQGLTSLTRFELNISVLQVGACIVNAENKIVGIGHNDMPNGCDGKFPWDRDAADLLENKHAYGKIASSTQTNITTSMDYSLDNLFFYQTYLEGSCLLVLTL